MSLTELVRSTFAVLALSVFASILAPPADAQYERDKKKTGGVTPTAPLTPAPATPAPAAPAPAPSPATTLGNSDAATAAVNPDIIALQTTSDLIIRDLGFNGKGEVTFELRNRGKVPINPASVDPTVAAAGRVAAPAVPDDKQIKVVAYLDNSTFMTLLHPRLAGQQSKTFTVGVPANLKPGCGQSRLLRTVIDPNNVIVELTDTNNVDTLTAARPCPDLAIESIEKNFNDLKTHFAARVTLINKGNATVERFEYWAKEDFGGHLADLGGQADESVGPLEPGQTHKFNIGFVPAYDNMRVAVILDWSKLVEELDEENNFKDKKLN